MAGPVYVRQDPAGQPPRPEADWLAALRRSLRYRAVFLIIIPLLLAAGVVILYRIDPSSGRGLIPCLFYQLTGINCIGCGTTRALHALLHGDLAAAASYNIFMLVWLPLPAYTLLAEWLEALAGRRLLPPVRDWRWLMIALAASSVLFFILRNLPWAPFNWLAA